MDMKNLAIIRQSFANTVFTHKVHEVAAELQEDKSFWVKIINIFLVSLVLAFLFLQTKFPESIIFSYVGVGITISEIIFLIVQLTFSFENRAISHKNSALKFLGLRDSYRLLITDVMNGSIKKSEIIYQRDRLQKEYQIISELAPQTGNKEYTKAQKKLNKRGAIQGEEFTWSDEEIDWFLPEELRLSN